jgi:glycosyltransferase involved in cell wall biosynthesis
MNVLYHFRTRGTGAEAVHIAGIARALESLGHSVVFSSPTGVDPRKTAGQSPYKDQGQPGLLARISRKCPGFVFELLEIGYNLAAFLRNRKLLRREKFDLLYERHAFFLCSSALLGLPIVLEVNELVGDQRVRAQPLFSFLARWSDRLIFKKAKLIVVVSPHLKRRIEQTGVPGEKILVLPNAVNAEEFATPADGKGVREKFALEGKTVIGFIGWFVEWHKLERLVEVFARLCHKPTVGGLCEAAGKEPNFAPGGLAEATYSARADLVLMLVGEGALREPLAQLARQLGVESQVLFTGSATHREIPAYIAAMDVCVVPHSNEYRSPIKLFEYMGQARAVLAPRLEPIEMIIEDGRNGLLFESTSAEQLQSQLERLVEDPPLRETLGTQARKDVLENHTWEQNARKILEKL